MFRNMRSCLGRVESISVDPVCLVGASKAVARFGRVSYLATRGVKMGRRSGPEWKFQMRTYWL